MDDHGPDVLLDHIREDRERRRQALVSVREYVDVGALGPVRVDGCMDRFFDFAAVEIKG